MRLPVLGGSCDPVWHLVALRWVPVKNYTRLSNVCMSAVVLAVGVQRR